MSSDQTNEIASVDVNRDQLIEGLRLLKKHASPRRREKAVVRREGGDLVIEIGGGAARAEASGRWEGEARLNGKLLLETAKHYSQDVTVNIRVEPGRFLFPGRSIPCEWVGTAAPHPLIPIGATLRDILRVGAQFSEEELEQSGHLESVRDARKKRTRLIRQAVKVLGPLQIAEEDLVELVDGLVSGELG